MGLLDNIGNKFTSMSDDDKRGLALGLASGFAGMSGNPNAPSIMAGIQSQQKALAANREKTSLTQQGTDQNNRTAQYLISKGGDYKKIGNALLLKQITGKQAMSMHDEILGRTPTETFSMVTDPEQLKLLDPTKNWQVGSLSNKFIAAGDKGSSNEFTKEDLGNINALRDDLGKELGQFNIIKQGYNNIMTFFKEPNQVTDYAMAVAFAKVLDPGSVAREGEVRAITNAGAKVPAFQAAFKNAIAGTGAMDPKMRYDIATAASALYEERSVEAINSIDKYDALGVKGGIPKGNIYLGSSVVPTMSIPPWNIPKELTAVNIGMTQKQWKNLPYRKKVEFMESLKLGAK
tara:strand:- start:1266 stop:2306 length:1041 start_codon:yes stop_codon:yes gene_type:complete